MIDKRTYWVEGKRWVEARMLEAGDEVWANGDRRLRVVALRGLDERATVYNLEVEGSHTYFAGDGEAWVHNGCGDGKGDPSRLRNGHLAGSKHPVTGVPFDGHGYPDFSDFRHPEVPDVRIPLSGNRAADAAAANAEAGLKTIPDDYVWHHHQDRGLMQLVDEWAHSKTGHTGGFSGK